MKVSPMMAKVLLAVLAASQMADAQGTPLNNAALSTLLNNIQGGATPTPADLLNLCATVNPTGQSSQAAILTQLNNLVGASTTLSPAEITAIQTTTDPTLATTLFGTCPIPSAATSSTTTTSSSSSSSSSSAASSTVSSSSSSSAAVTTSSSSIASSSVSSTVSSTSSSASSSASAVNSFVVQVGGSASAKLRRRQALTSGFIGADGSLVSTCAQAASFSITANGQLAGSGGGLVSTDGTAANALFVAVNPPLSISTAFGGNPLTWSNSAFAGGAASFAELNGQVYSVFQTAPAGSSAISLTQVALSACTDINGGGNTVNNNNTTINNISVSGDTYNVNGSIYNNSFNNQATVNGDNNNVNVGANNSISAGQQVSVKSVLPVDVWAQFDANTINYYSSDDYYFYGKFCHTCAIIPFQKRYGSYEYYYYDSEGVEYVLSAFTIVSISAATPCVGWSSAQAGVVVYGESKVYDCGCDETATTTGTVTIHPVSTVTSSHVVVTDVPVVTAVTPAPPATVTAAVPNSVVTGGAVVVNGGSTTVTPETPATTVTPFTGAAGKNTVKGGAFLALFGLLLL